ncbi:hypothetical protein [Actinobacillus porcinus]|uniref:hypothetical protein n=1 Tax=Actinobacillus porcinus TaxID=51048 RepID=UPI00111A40E0|nr:hypothetical protein [Actinobacillus porcinus]MDD7545659.1 hypothetical protein [Actinobacillus porcinus]MDY5422011.1 hypothetical protein [Actinobacillus porcinus]
MNHLTKHIDFALFSSGVSDSKTAFFVTALLAGKNPHYYGRNAPFSQGISEFKSKRICAKLCANFLFPIHKI